MRAVVRRNTNGSPNRDVKIEIKDDRSSNRWIIIPNLIIAIIAVSTFIYSIYWIQRQTRIMEDANRNNMLFLNRQVEEMHKKTVLQWRPYLDILQFEPQVEFYAVKLLNDSVVLQREVSSMTYENLIGGHYNLLEVRYERKFALKNWGRSPLWLSLKIPKVLDLLYWRDSLKKSSKALVCYLKSKKNKSAIEYLTDIAIYPDSSFKSEGADISKAFLPFGYLENYAVNGEIVLYPTYYFEYKGLNDSIYNSINVIHDIYSLTKINDTLRIIRSKSAIEIQEFDIEVDSLNSE